LNAEVPEDSRFPLQRLSSILNPLSSRSPTPQQLHGPVAETHEGHGQQTPQKPTCRMCGPEGGTASGADPAPGNLHGAEHGQQRAADVRRECLPPLTMREVGEACRHAATGTGVTEQRPERAFGEAKLLVRAESTRI